jgi:mono/diheme cytochrome c family protein
MARIHARLLLTCLVAAACTAAAAETALERGRYLVQSIVACGNCHTPNGPNGKEADKELAGGFLIEDKPFTAYAPNITPDPQTGIGRWTDAQIATAIREGRRPDGTIIGPPMPIAFCRGLSDADVAAIVAYGRYLAGPAGHCLECHTTPGPDGAADIRNRLGASGLVFNGPRGVSVAANITPTGIGRYPDAELQRIITTGTRPDGSRLKPPMGTAYYARMAAADLDALVAYLRTLPPK